MAGICKKPLDFFEGCSIVMLKIYHIILIVLLIFSSIGLYSTTPDQPTMDGLNQLYGNQVHTLINVFVAIYICATIIGLIGAVFNNKLFNSVFFIFATCSLVGLAVYKMTGIENSPPSESHLDEVSGLMKYVDWHQKQKIENASTTRVYQGGYMSGGYSPSYASKHSISNDDDEGFEDDPLVDHLQKRSVSGMNSGYVSSYSDFNVQVAKYWNRLQSSLECCGLHSRSEWTNLTSLEHGFPSSCCPNSPLYCYNGYEIGCVERAIKHHHGLLYLVSVAIQFQVACLNVLMSFSKSKETSLIDVYALV